MSLPISVGDAILLSQIAWSIGKAFTSGRKSAPAEFAEIQDLLFTLGEALKALAEDLPSSNHVAQDEKAADKQDEEAQVENALLAQMVMNCQSTLIHLKSIVDKYMELDKKVVQKDQKKWKDEVKKNWKKLMWTKEGGDIIKLKTTLTAHINGLNLALSVINKRNGGEVKGHVESMHTKLDDIYDWFKQNLEGRHVATTPMVPQHQPDAQEQNHNRIYFSVSIQTIPGREHRKVYCPRAKFQDDWLDKDNPYRTAPSIFQCCCSPSLMAIDHTEALHASLLLSSMLVQLTTQDPGSPHWHMYVASRSTPYRISSVYISESGPTNFQDLEAAASRLSLVQAHQHLLRNQSTSLVSFDVNTGSSSSDDPTDGIVSVLASKAELVPEDDEGTCTLLLRVGERQFSATANTTYRILHYKSLPGSVVRKVPSDTLVGRLEDMSKGEVALTSAMGYEIHQPHAEVLFQEVKKELGIGGDNTYYITFYHDTTISHVSGPRTVCVKDVLVVFEQNTDPSKPSIIQQIKCDAIDVEFGDSNDAQTLLSSLRSMQSHLFYLYLTRPLFGEHTLFRRSAGDMIVRDHLLPSATISLVYSPGTDVYRVILLAGSRAVSACMPLSPRQLEDLMTNQNAGSKQFSTYFLVRNVEGTEVVQSSVRLDELGSSGTGVGLHPLLSTKEDTWAELREENIEDE